MIDQTVTIKSPITVIPSKVYLLVIKDANGVTHFWHKKHRNRYGKFASGQYDGWSKEMTENNCKKIRSYNV